MRHSNSYWVWTSIILTTAALAATLLQVAIILGRRWMAAWRNRSYSPAFNSIQQGLEDFAQGRCDYAALLQKVRVQSSVLPAPALQQWMLSPRLLGNARNTIARLAADLGWPEEWQAIVASRKIRASEGSAAASRMAGGRMPDAAQRAEAARKLGLIGWNLDGASLAAALDDPSPEVARAALRSMAAGSSTGNLELLSARLCQCATAASPSVSVRTLCGAMARFPLSESAALIECLEHSHARVRLLAAWVVLEMIKRGRKERPAAGAAALPASVREIFLTQLVQDPKPDVRARAAAVAGYVPDARAADAVARLMQDEEWIVRLHAVRSAALLHNAAHTPFMRARLQDSHWRVREAVAQTLADWKPAGLEALLESLAVTRDSYAREQIVEMLQRKNLLGLEVEWSKNTDAPLEIRKVADIIEWANATRPQSESQAEDLNGLSVRLLDSEDRSMAPKLDR